MNEIWSPEDIDSRIKVLSKKEFIDFFYLNGFNIYNHEGFYFNKEPIIGHKDKLTLQHIEELNDNNPIFISNCKKHAYRVFANKLILLLNEYELYPELDSIFPITLTRYTKSTLNFFKGFRKDIYLKLKDPLFTDQKFDIDNFNTLNNFIDLYNAQNRFLDIFNSKIIIQKNPKDFVNKNLDCLIEKSVIEQKKDLAEANDLLYFIDDNCELLLYTNENDNFGLFFAIDDDNIFVPKLELIPYVKDSTKHILTPPHANKRNLAMHALYYSLNIRNKNIKQR